MNSIKLFNKDIPIRSHYCSFFDDEPKKVEEQYVSIYVRYNGCDAKCKFCIWYNDAQNFDEDKWKEILIEITSKIKVKKICFSGGEPTLNWNRFKRVLLLTKKISPKSLIVVNTNGIRLKKLFNDEIINLINSVSLSRHHYDDIKNDYIFNTNTISSTEIKEIQAKHNNKNLLHLNCNLIKNFIDNNIEIYNYLEYVNDLGINSVGLISLMPVNDFSKKNFIGFDVSSLISDRFCFLKEYNFTGKCTCRNYIYIPKNLRKPIHIYYKNTYNPFELSALTFDGKNLKIGFTDKIII